MFKECFIFEVLIGGKLCNFISLYRSPSQSSDSFEKFADNLHSHEIKLVAKTHSLRLFWVILILNPQIGISAVK